jgi:hypothetical protein
MVNLIELGFTVTEDTREPKKQHGKCRGYARDAREVKNSQRLCGEQSTNAKQGTSGECMDVRQMKMTMTKKGDSFQVSPDEFKNRIEDNYDLYNRQSGGCDHARR